jgi:oligo-1,6-glucosidase
MEKRWWKEEVIYQIYPRSFQDSDGNGIGDINGIISRLDYIQDLGVDIIWLGPVYMSPNDDNGYDISDYYAIHPEFGTMAEFELMLSEMKKRNLKLIMDLVVNHSSDEHKWFEQSRQSQDNEYRDFYFWKPPREGGGPPNNWLSFFGGSAWEYDDKTGEYYLHLFTKKQPDLNWENNQVREKVYEIMRFWLDKGIDGFRMDVISLISKDLSFSDASFSSFGELVEKVYANGPRVHEFLQEMNEKVLKHYDVMTVGEGPGITTITGLDYVDHKRRELSMIFHLDHMFLGFGEKGRFDPELYDWNDVKAIFREWYKAMGDLGWLSVFLDNHDFPRMVSRFGNDTQYRVESAKMLATLVLTMPGTPCIYQGSEIGMTNVQFKAMADFRDVETLNFYKQMTGEGMSQETFIDLANKYGRDNVRTPMQWDASAHAGFTKGTPWIGLNDNYKEVNVKECIESEDSILHFYRELIAFRKKTPAMVYGKWIEHLQSNEDLYIYSRVYENEAYLIVLNHSDRRNELDISAFHLKSLVLTNWKSVQPGFMNPWECRLYKLDL